MRQIKHEYDSEFMDSQFGSHQISQFVSQPLSNLPLASERDVKHTISSRMEDVDERDELLHVHSKRDTLTYSNDSESKNKENANSHNKFSDKFKSNQF